MFTEAGIDFRLLSSSMAIDAGINVGLTSDYLGNPVPVGGGYDIGAYEYNEFDYYPSYRIDFPPHKHRDDRNVLGVSSSLMAVCVSQAKGQYAWSTTTAPTHLR